MAVELLSQLTTGFQNPAADYHQGRISLDAQLVEHPAATFYFRQDNDSMIGAGIPPNAVLMVDKLAPKKHGSIVIAIVDQEFICRWFTKEGMRNMLVPDNKKYKPVDYSEFATIEIFGVVKQIIIDSRFL